MTTINEIINFEPVSSKKFYDYYDMQMVMKFMDLKISTDLSKKEICEKLPGITPKSINKSFKNLNLESPYKTQCIKKPKKEVRFKDAINNFDFSYIDNITKKKYKQ